MKCVSLFSGAGGLDLGLEAAGFDVIASVEQDSDCCHTLKANGRKGVIKGDVADVDFAALKERGPIDLLAGGPPCQPFSKSALWTQAGTRGLSDPRSNTIQHYISALAVLEPRAFLIENVEGFAKWGGLAALKEGLAQLADRGLRYSLSEQILSAVDYGVPQKRRRLFAVGMREGGVYEFPAPTHGTGLEPYATSWDACSSVRFECEEESLAVRGRWADLLPTIPAGRNYLFHTSRGEGEPLFGWRTRFWSFLYKLHPSEPSPTIVATPSQNSGPFHWQNRLLSTLELASIQTFPSDYIFHGERVSRQRQIGNAVPPLLAEAVGRSLMSQLGGAVKDALSFRLSKADVVPEMPLIAPVPAKFRDRIGDHADHPGTGRGPRGRSRRQPTLQVEESV
jgi:DNA (cytosine-5)-methyltransferase 1